MDTATTAAPAATRPIVTITLRHPDVALLATTGRGALDTYRAALTGDWAAIADLCADPAAGGKVPDLAAARRALAQAAADSGIVFATPTDVDASSAIPTQEIVEAADGGETAVVFTGAEGVILSVLDLFARLMCGQWSEADWHATMNAPSMERTSGGWDPYGLNRVRSVVCTTRDHLPGEVYRPLEPHEFPDHPNGSIGIAESPLPAKIAYHAYKMLGAGAAGSPTFSLPNGPLVVEVDGVEVNRIRSY